jgi:hypothetical protein
MYETFRVIFFVYRINFSANQLMRSSCHFFCHPIMNVRSLLLLLFISALDPGNALAGTNSWFPGMTNSPAIIPALPTNFVAVAVGSAAKTNKVLDLKQGLVWASEQTAHSLEFSDARPFASAREALFHLALSQNIKQKPGTDTFTDEQEMPGFFTRAGMVNVKSSKTKWGPYPVFMITSERPDGSVFYNAWLGLNSPDRLTIAINYRIPHSEGHPTKEERAIWETFVKGTQGK